MKSPSAMAKLKAILIIDLIIVALAATSFFYLDNQGLLASGPKPAEFVLSDFAIKPVEVEEGEQVLVSANLTNIGEVEATYLANFTINGIFRANQTILLPGGNFTIIEFTDVEDTAGTYIADIDGLNGSFTVKPAPPTSSNIKLSNLVTSPYESWEGEEITAKVTATNPTSEVDRLSVKLSVDDLLVETKRIELAPGETADLTFNFTTTGEGKHSVKVNSLIGSFYIVPTGMHTLFVRYSGGGSDKVPSTLNGEDREIPYSELLPVGTYTITLPAVFQTQTAVFNFGYWNDGDKRTTKTIDLQDRTLLVATYILISGYSSCPSLYIWNGTNYSYVTEISNAGWLGYMDHINKDGNIVYAGGNPWDYIKLDKNQLAQQDGHYDMALFQQWDEIFYLDTAYLMVVDHPSDVDVYSTMVNYINKDFMGQIYTIEKDSLLAPISAVNEKGQDVSSQISKIDGIFTPGNNGLASPSWDNITMNQLTLNLGNLSGAQEIKLVIHGMVDWGSPEFYYVWVDKIKTAFAEGLAPTGTQIYPAPSMEVMDKNGNWIRVPQDRQMPTPADYVPRSFAVDLTDLFPPDTSEYQIRINNFFNVTFDYIGIDVSPQEDIAVYRIEPIATLYPVEFGITESQALGSFTKYGDVTPLLLEADDMFVIGMQGDQVNLKFSSMDLPLVEDGLERDFFLFVACWFKDPPGNWGYGFEFTVDPLPFRDMSGFPYPPTENYPSSEEYLRYLQEWNTRTR